MSDRPPAGVVVDTMVISWLFDARPNQLADRYREVIGDGVARLRTPALDKEAPTTDSKVSA